MTLSTNIPIRPSADDISSNMTADSGNEAAASSSTSTATATAAPSASPIPPAINEPVETPSTETTDSPDVQPFEYPKPKLRLEIRDISHEGADVFLQSVNAAAILAAAVGNVQRLLYGRNFWHADPDCHITPTRSVTVILRSMGGVAYTTGSELDGDHKEIHFSLEYIAGIRPRKERATAEIAGVLTHELVHCYQWNGLGSCPGGLIEGIADWVRLRCALEPPHWKREPAAVGRWDGGYQHTAYFLDYLENRFGSGTVRRINEKLRLERYNGKSFWADLLGDSVETLWQNYADAVKEGRPEVSSAPEPENLEEKPSE